MQETEEVRRILIIDDNESIHQQIRRILAPTRGKDLKNSLSKLDSIGAKVFGTEEKGPATTKTYQLTSALQGEQGFEIVKKSMEENRPFAMAIVDMRMPPGWDGLKTIEHIWKVSPETQILICTAYADFSWQEINKRLAFSDRFLILKKPFDISELEQMAAALTEKWRLIQERKLHIADLKSAKLEAEAGLIAKRNFLAMMSHEFRTPMNAIMGAFQFIRQTLDNNQPDIQQMIGLAETATTELLTLLDSVIDYMDLEHGKIKLSQAGYNLESLVRKTSKNYSKLAATFPRQPSN